MKIKWGMFIRIQIVFLFTAAFILASVQESGQNNPTLSLQQLWERCQETLPPFSYTVVKDEIVQSNTDIRQRLRRIEVRFTSQIVGQWMRRMQHTGIIYMPSDPKIYNSPERKGKVVVVANRYGDTLMVDNYGEPIAARTGYPTMVLPIPGEYDGHDGESSWIYFLRSQLLDTKDPMDHKYFRLAIPYISALDVFSGILEEDNIKAVIGGHSKRAPSAFNAAAMDTERIAGVIYMGNESTYSNYENSIHQGISPFYSQKYVKCPVFYIGATNEDGYEMFNISKLQAGMTNPWTIEYIPNYRHATNSEKQPLAWMMWISHIFEGRPLTKISDLSYEENPEGTIFRARIDTPNKLIQTKLWYVYCDDVPFWRDLMWYPAFMRKKGDVYEAFVSGILPDAWLVEVKDTADGFSGYISSLPQDITHKPTKERVSRGWRSRNWALKKRIIKK